MYLDVIVWLHLAGRRQTLLMFVIQLTSRGTERVSETEIRYPAVMCQYTEWSSVSHHSHFIFCALRLEIPPPLMPTHFHIDFVVPPSGCGRSVTEFWGWGAHRAQLRCSDDVSDDVYERGVPGGATWNKSNDVEVLKYVSSLKWNLNLDTAEIFTHLM
jgi:hypothetical protein